MQGIVFLIALMLAVSAAVADDTMLCGHVFLLMEETNELINVEPSDDLSKHPLVDAIFDKWGDQDCLSQDGFGEWWADMNMTGESPALYDFINNDGDNCIDIDEMKEVANKCLSLLPF